MVFKPRSHGSERLGYAQSILPQVLRVARLTDKALGEESRDSNPFSREE